MGDWLKFRMPTRKPDWDWLWDQVTSCPHINIKKPAIVIAIRRFDGFRCSVEVNSSNFENLVAWACE